MHAALKDYMSKKGHQSQCALSYSGLGRGQAGSDLLKSEVVSERSEHILTPLEPPPPAEGKRAMGKQSHVLEGNYGNQWKAILKSYSI